MKPTVQVPSLVIENAKYALDLHTENRVEDTYGIALAERLVTGQVSIDDVRKITRFHRVNGRRVEEVQRGGKTEATDSDVRSFLLHGGEHGRAWAEGVRAEADKDIPVRESDVDTLFDRTPDDIYEAFSFNAWRYEFDLDPKKAALFVEDYKAATGYDLDFKRAFQEGAEAVSNALVRRTSTVDPMKVLIANLTAGDDDVKEAARADLADLAEMAGPVDENISNDLKKPKTAASRVAWPALVAHLILAVEDRNALDPYVGKYPPSPNTALSVGAWSNVWCDATRAYITFLHPEGHHYVAPTDEAGWAVGNAMYDLLLDITIGKKVVRQRCINVLNSLRDLAKEQKWNGQLLNTMIVAWKKGNWAAILELLPPDCDVLTAFQVIAKVNPTPADGVDVQKLAIGADITAAKAAVAAAHDIPDMEEMVKQIDITKTASYVEAKIKGTPFGVKSVLTLVDGADAVVLGAYELKGADKTISFKNMKGDHFDIPDNLLATLIETEKVKIKLVTASQPGTNYSDPIPAPTAPAKVNDPGKSAESLDGYIAACFKDAANVVKVDPFEGRPWQGTAMNCGLDTKLGTLLYHHDHHAVFEVIGAINLLDDKDDFKDVSVQAGNYLIVREKRTQLDESDAEAMKSTYQKYLHWSSVYLGTMFNSYGIRPLAEVQDALKHLGPFKPAYNAAVDKINAGIVRKWAPLADVAFKKALSMLGLNPVSGVKVEIVVENEVTVVGLLGAVWLDSQPLPQSVWAGPDGNPLTFSPGMFLTSVKAKSIRPVSPAGEKPKPVAQMGDIVQDESGYYYYVDDVFTGANDEIVDYNLVSFRFQGEVPFVTVPVKAKWMEKFQIVGSTFNLADVQKFAIAGSLVSDPTAYPEGTGVTIMKEPGVALYKFIDNDGGERVVYWINSSIGHTKLAHAGLVSAPAMNAGPTPQPGTAEDSNAEDPHDNLSGTPAAFAWCKTPPAEITQSGGGNYWLVSDGGTITPVAKKDITPKCPFVIGDVIENTEKKTTYIVHGYAIVNGVTSKGAKFVRHIIVVNKPTKKKGKADLWYIYASTAADKCIKLEHDATILASAQPASSASSGIPFSATPAPKPEQSAAHKAEKEATLKALYGGKPPTNPDFPEAPKAEPTTTPVPTLNYTIPPKYEAAFSAYLGKHKRIPLPLADAYKGKVTVGDYGFLLDTTGDKIGDAPGTVVGCAAPLNTTTVDELKVYVAVETATEVMFVGMMLKYVSGFLKQEETYPFAKTNYTVPKAQWEAVKKWLVGHPDFYLDNAPRTPFNIGQQIKMSGSKISLACAWVTQNVNGTPGSLLALEGGELVLVASDLMGKVKPVFKGKTEVIPNETATLARDVESIYTPSIGKEFTEDFAVSAPIKQPAFKTATKGKHISAGVIAIMDSGDTIKIPGADQIDGEHMRVLLYKPTNNYGGYGLCIPKGTLEGGESIEMAAVREVFEETGFKVELSSFLGDFSATTSVVRLFIGRVIGGSVSKAGPECDGVVFADCNADPTKTEWFKKLVPEGGSKWQQEAIKAAWAKLTEVGRPEVVPPDLGEVHAAATSAKVTVAAAFDVPKLMLHEGQGPLAVSLTTVQGLGDDDDKQKPSEIDYTEAEYDEGIPVFTLINMYLIGDADIAPNMVSWSALPYVAPLPEFVQKPGASLASLGYPPPGARFSFLDSENDTTTYFAVAYYAYRNIDGTFKVGMLARDEEVGDDETNKYPPDFIHIRTEAGVWASPDIFLPPHHVAEVSLPSTGSSQQLIADAVATANFPLPPAAVKAVSKYIAENYSAAVITSLAFTTVDTHIAKGRPSGTQVTHPDSSSNPSTILGFVMVATQKNAAGIMLAVTADASDYYRVDPSSKMKNWPVVPKPTDLGTFLGLYTHPDPLVNEKIAKIAQGVPPAYLGMNLFTFAARVSEAGYPLAKYITAPLIPTVAKLFIPNGLSSGEFNALKKALTALKHANEAKVKPVTPSSFASTTTVSMKSTTTQPQVPVMPEISTGPEGMKALLALSASDLTEGVSGSEAGLGKGSTPIYVVKHKVTGQEFVLKEAKTTEGIEPHAEQAAAIIGAEINSNTVPLVAFTKGGKIHSIQPRLKESGAVPANPATLSDSDKVEVLRQHVVDMFFQDHDGQTVNWIMTPGGIRRIDMGRAFKGFIKGEPITLELDVHPGVSLHGGSKYYAKQLLGNWETDAKVIPTSAFSAMRSAIAKVQGLSDDFLKQRLESYFTAQKLDPKKQAAVLKTIGKWRDNYLNEWTKQLTKLRSDFAWPTKMPLKATVDEVLAASPEMYGITEAEDKAVKESEAVKPMWRTIRVDRGSVERQEVTVRVVNSTAASSQAVPGVLMFWKVTAKAGQQAGEKMLKLSENGNSGGSSSYKSQATAIKKAGKTQAVADITNGYADAVKKAIVSVNSRIDKHYNAAPDKAAYVPDWSDSAKGNVAKVRDVIIPAMKQILKEASGKTGDIKFKDGTDDVAEAAYGMAFSYLTYCESIVDAFDNWKQYLGKPLPMFKEFIFDYETWYETHKKGGAPDEKAKAKAMQKPSGFKIRSESLMMPQFAESKGSSKLSAFSGGIQSPQNSQAYVVEDNVGTYLRFAPPKKDNSRNGHRTYLGMCWAFAPQPDGDYRQAVKKALALFEASSGIPMRPATEEARQVAAWVRHAIGASPVKHGDDTGEIPKTPEVKAILEKFDANEDGDPEVDAALVKELQEYTAKAAGVDVATLVKRMNAEPSITLDDGSGKPFGPSRDVSPLMSSAELDKWMRSINSGTLPMVGHHSSGIVKIIEESNIPALIPAAEGQMVGIVVHGGAGTQSSDSENGGGDYIFTALEARVQGENCVWFHPEVLRWEGTVITGLGDSFGNMTLERYMSPVQMKTAKGGNIIDHCGSPTSGSSPQIIIKHGLPLSAAMFITVAAGSVDAVKANLKKRGVTSFYKGRTLDQVVTTVANAEKQRKGM